MPTLRAILGLELNGVVMDNSPLFKRVELDEISHFTFDKATDALPTTFTALPGVDQLGTLQGLLLMSTQTVTVRLAAQSDAGLTLTSSGMLFLTGVTVTPGSTGVTINNSSGSTATITGIIFGT